MEDWLIAVVVLVVVVAVGAAAVATMFIIYKHRQKKWRRDQQASFSRGISTFIDVQKREGAIQDVHVHRLTQQPPTRAGEPVTSLDGKVNDPDDVIAPGIVLPPPPPEDPPI